jgi:glycosyltransferase involved in cell wall biosynthesis
MTALPALAPASEPRARVLFVNSGILGHRAVAGLIEDTVRLASSLDATHIDLSRGLTLGDRIARRLFSVRLAPGTGVAGNLDFRRWREELNVGLLAARRIAAAERHQRFDVLHFHTQAAAYASVRRMQRTPSIVSIDATQRLASREAVSSIGRLTYQPNIAHDRRIFSRAAAIVSTSEWAARDLVQDDPRCASKLQVMPYPVRPLCDAQWLARRSNEQSSPPRVLFMGGDFPRKGGADLLDVWRAEGLSGRATLDLVTDWPLDAAQLPGGVTLRRGITPHSPAWTELWRHADLFAMPTRHEAFGMVFQEAAAAGLPVVATHINAIPEIVVDGVTGMLVPPRDRAALAQALRTLIIDGELRRRLGAAGFERSRTIYAPERYASRLEAVVHAARGGL